MTRDVATETITTYLTALAKGDDVLALHLVTALQGPLRKLFSQPEAQRHPQPLSFTARLTNWLCLEYGKAVNGFNPDPELKGKIDHIVDWIAGAYISKEPWLQKCDDQGRCLKLLNIGSIEQAMKKADKAMYFLAQKARNQLGTAPTSEGETLVHRFDDGYSFVQLTTPEALDRETAMTGHCVGNGNYDEDMLKGRIALYSLRDRKNKSHATLEVEIASNRLKQCEGKQKAAPVARYLPYIKDFIRERKYDLCDFTAGRQQVLTDRIGLVSIERRYYDINDFPEDLNVYELRLFLCNSLTQLPKRLKVYELDLMYCKNLTQISEDVRVVNNLYLSHCTGLIRLLSEDLDVKRLDLSYCKSLIQLPKRLKAQDLDLSHCESLAQLPEDLEAQNLTLYGCKSLKELPLSLKADKIIGADHLLEDWKRRKAAQQSPVISPSVYGLE